MGLFEVADHQTPVPLHILASLHPSLRKDSPDASDVHVNTATWRPVPKKKRKRSAHSAGGFSFTAPRRIQKAVLPLDTAASVAFAKVLRASYGVLGAPSETSIARALKSGNADPVLESLDWTAWEKHLMAGLVPLYQAEAESWGRASARQLARGLPMTKSKPVLPASVAVTLQFAAKDPAVIAWVLKHAAALITHISTETKQAIRDVIHKVYTSGTSPANAVPLVRAALGEPALFPAWQNAVLNYGAALQEAETPGALELVDAYRERLIEARSTMIARTEILSAQNAGRLASFQQAVDAGFVDAKTAKKQWLAAPEGACPICDKLNGQQVGLDATFPTGDMGPPAHPNAVLAGSTFAPYGELREFAKAWYSGPAVCVHGSSDGPTIIGPNHPMLTTTGMVRASELREGDDLVRDTRVKRLGTDSDLQQMPLVEDAFKAACSSGEHARVPAAADDFHGDGERLQGEVHVVWPDGYLLPVLDPSGIEEFREGDLVRSDTELAFIARERSRVDGLGLVRSASPRGVGGGGHPGPLIGSHPFPPDAVGLAQPVGTPELDVLAHPSVSTSGPFTTDRVRFTHLVHFQGWAFDASTESSLYCSSGYVVSNCRCTTLLRLGQSEPVMSGLPTARDLKKYQIQAMAQRDGYDALIDPGEDGTIEDPFTTLSIWDASKIAVISDSVRKYNKIHDPHSGEFTSGGGGVSLAAPPSGPHLSMEVLAFGSSGHFQVLALDEHGERQGYLTVAAVHNEQDKFEVRWVQVLPGWQNQGVATRMAEALHEEMTGNATLVHQDFVSWEGYAWAQGMVAAHPSWNEIGPGVHGEPPNGPKPAWLVKASVTEMLKYNENHDRHTGEFTSAAGGGVLDIATSGEDLSEGAKAKVSGALVEFDTTVSDLEAEIDKRIGGASSPAMVEGAKWYPGANAFATHIATRTGLPLERVIAAIAVISPKVDWDANARIGEQMAEFQASGKADGLSPQEATDLFISQTRAVTALPENIIKGFAVLGGASIDATLGGAKVRSFYNNITAPGQTGEVTVDGHMAKAFGAASGLTKAEMTKLMGRKSVAAATAFPSAGYIAIAEATRRVAERYGVSADAVQAAYWIQIRKAFNLRWPGKGE